MCEEQSTPKSRIMFILAHVTLLCFTESWMWHPRQTPGAPPDPRWQQWQLPRPLQRPPHLCTAQRQMSRHEVLIWGNWGTELSEVSSGRVCNRTETPPGSCSKRLGLIVGKPGERTTFNYVKGVNLTDTSVTTFNSFQKLKVPWSGTRESCGSPNTKTKIKFK